MGNLFNNGSTYNGTYTHFPVPPTTRDIPMLLSADSYLDTQLASNNKYETWGIKVLNGTENWLEFMSGFYMKFNGLKSMTTDRAGFCTHYAFSDGTGGASNGTFIYNGSPTNGNVTFRDDSIGTAVSDWKAYLASEYAKGTPVIVLYPLATPATSTITITPVSTPTKVSRTATSSAEIATTGTVSYHNVTVTSQWKMINDRILVTEANINGNN